MCGIVQANASRYRLKSHWGDELVANGQFAAQKSAGVAADEVGGIGLTGQMHGLVLLDKAGKVLRPAMLWNDQRTQA